MGNYEILVISVLSWVAGIFFWAIIEDLRGCPHCKDRYEKMIRNTYQNLIKELGVKLRNENGKGIDKINKTEYYKAYYAVQEKGLLGPVGILESFSAFFFNFAFVAFYWIAIIVILVVLDLIFIEDGKPCGRVIERFFNFDQLDINLNSYLFVLILLVLIGALIWSSYCSRKSTEERIIKSVLMAYMLCPKNN